MDTLIELKYNDAPIITKNNLSSYTESDIPVSKGKCIVCGSNQDWKDILKLELLFENEHNMKNKTLKDIQIAANKLGFGSYSKFLTKCNHENLLTEINNISNKKFNMSKSKKHEISIEAPKKYFNETSSVLSSKSRYFNKTNQELMINDNDNGNNTKVTDSTSLPYLSTKKYLSSTKNENSKSIMNIDDSSVPMKNKFSIIAKHKKN